MTTRATSDDTQVRRPTRYTVDIEVDQIARDQLDEVLIRSGLHPLSVVAHNGGAAAVIDGGSETGLARVRRLARDQFGAALVRCDDQVLAGHLGGKLATRATHRLTTHEDLAIAYTPGVGRVVELIHADPDLARFYTARNNTVAIVTDGTAVLGLGDRGPLAALPVMEGKAVLFSELAGLNAYPLCLATTDIDEIVDTVVRLAPSFGAVDLEDIAAPRCFEVEARLRARLDLPVLHDDQHGTAVVVLAGILNALRIVDRPLADVRIVVAGPGAAGVAVTEFLLAAGATDVTVWTRAGILHADDDTLPANNRTLARHTNPRLLLTGDLAVAVRDAHVFIGLSGPDILTRAHVETMAPDPIVFALANPAPEIDPDTIADLAAVTATGRSDHPN